MTVPQWLYRSLRAFLICGSISQAWQISRNYIPASLVRTRKLWRWVRG